MWTGIVQNAVEVLLKPAIESYGFWWCNEWRKIYGKDAWVRYVTFHRNNIKGSK